MLESNVLIVSGAPLTVVKVRPPKMFGTETVNMSFSAEEKELTLDSRFKGSGSLRMRKCNFAAKDQRPVESFKSSFLHRSRQACHTVEVLMRVRKLDRALSFPASRTFWF